MFSKAIRGFLLTVFSLLVYGFGLAGFIYALYFCHSYIEGKLDAKIFSVLYILAIVTLGFLVVGIVTGFVNCYPLSIVSTVAIGIAFVLNVIAASFLLGLEDKVYNIVKLPWTYKGFNGIRQELEKRYECNGWDADAEDSEYGFTCLDSFKHDLKNFKVFIVIFFFTGAFLDAIAFFISFLAILEDKEKHKIGNDDENNGKQEEEEDESNSKDPEAPGKTEEGQDQTEETQPAVSEETKTSNEESQPANKAFGMRNANGKANYQAPKVNHVPVFAIKEKAEYDDEEESYYYYTSDQDSDTESK